MLRPIPPHLAWQAITALAGFFTLVCALAAPVDLWRLSVKSRQGEPFLATVTLVALPEEHISTECLSMGPESDAPGSEMPFLSKANLKLDAARSAVEISTDEPVGAPGLALVVRVQCAGAPLYARHFSALIPPAVAKLIPVAKAQERRADARPMKRRGFHLGLLPGDTVESVAAVIFPGKRATQRNLVQQVIAGNPNVFPNGRSREVPTGTVLWFPDLREIRRSSREKPSSSARRTATHRAGHTRPPAEGIEEVPARPRKPITLRRALELGDKPGPQECRRLMQLCGAESASVALGPPSLQFKAVALESGVKELHLKQDSIDQQLQLLEQSLQTLQKNVNSKPAPAAAESALSPPIVEISAVVKSAPVDWTIWLGLAGLIVAAVIGGFAYRRRGLLSRGLAETDEQLDRMLASAATPIRELESTPKPARARPTAVPASRPSTRLPPAIPAAPEQPAGEWPPTAAPGSEPDFVLYSDAKAAPTELDFNLESEAMALPRELDLNLESERPALPQMAGLSNEVMYDMDQALDITRSMFMDVDRFIALGRTQNALSLLQFQVNKDPKDRDSWIKLLAIYRQEQMDVELAKAVREFRNHFPHENPPVV